MAELYINEAPRTILKRASLPTKKQNQSYWFPLLDCRPFTPIVPTLICDTAESNHTGLATHHDADQPHEERKQEIKRDKQAEEPSHHGHPATLTQAGEYLVSQHDGVNAVCGQET